MHGRRARTRVALGESIVAIGIGAQGRLGAGFIVASILGLALAAAVWWLYFDGEDQRAERALASAEAQRRPWLALSAFGYALLPILGGIVMLAAGIKMTIAHDGEPIAAPAAWFLAGLAAATGIVGVAISPPTELGTLVAIVACGTFLESRHDRAMTR